MPYELLTHYLRLPVFFLVVSRLGGLILFQPIFGALAVPSHLRMLLVVGLAALVTPFVSLTTPFPATIGGVALALVGELALGALVGLVVAIGFLGLQLGGLLIAQESGLAFGQIVDPSSGEEESVLSSLYLQLGAVIYLIVGGHRAVFAACLDTFSALPLLASHDVASAGVELLCAALAAGGELAIRVAAPAVLTMFLLNVAMGFISRTVPQLNVTTLGFSFKALVGFVIMAVALPTALTAFTDGLATFFGWLQAWMDAAGA